MRRIYTIGAVLLSIVMLASAGTAMGAVSGSDTVSVDQGPEEVTITEHTDEDHPDDGDSNDSDTDDEGEEAPEASVDISDQDSDGTTVTVDEVTMSEGGFVTIHDDTLLEGDALGSVIGVSEYLEAGTHQNVEVTLFTGVPGADFEESEELEDGATVIAMPHLDSNDNETYDFVTSEGADDGPYVGEDGTAVTDDAVVTVTTAEDEPDETAVEDSVSFENQDSNGTTVTVDEVTLSEGGFVTIHDETLLSNQVFESVIGVSEYLEAGTHQNVEVTLFTDVPGANFEEGETLEDGALVIAMPHLDSNDNQTYDFVTSEGAEDGPYVNESGEPLTTEAIVSVDAGADAGADAGDDADADEGDEKGSSTCNSGSD